MLFLKKSILLRLSQFFETLSNNLERRVKNFGAQYIAFGMFGILNYPIFYLIWIFYNKKSYESLALRLVATILCLILLLKNFWPQKLKPWLPLYWYFTLLFCLPFFFFFMLFKNNGANVWLMSSNTILFWLLLLVDWESYIFIFVLGFLLAVGIFFLTTPHFAFGFEKWWGVSAQFIASFIVVLFFARKKQEFDERKRQLMNSIGASIAHELRTPLATLRNGAKNLKRYLPSLIAVYQKTQNENLPQEKIPIFALNTLEKLPEFMESETKSAFTFIDMLLMNVNPMLDEKIETFSIGDCVEEAFSRYPFTEEQRNLIHLQKDHDFKVKGQRILLIHVLFNLIKNALYYIAKASKGEIRIWLDADSQSHYLYFKDTGQGIKKEDLPHVFERFYSKTYHGSGIGLAFCKQAMEVCGGKITCESVYESYTQFILCFPKIL